ncbi:hypothetical protein [Prochlorococcus sp. MIT 1303]|nr:hypothetical protein [Prochlorococcus sp. MIT 1303]
MTTYPRLTPQQQAGQAAHLVPLFVPVSRNDSVILITRLTSG